ncbi:MAG: hypothetical protein J5590_01245 [Clostridia bacterium]|nr:hypothetical protein [Clostridia bacterium]
MQIVLVFAIIALLFAAGYIISNAVLSQKPDSVIEITIDGDKAGEQLEDIALSVRIVADKYFKNSSVFVRGGRSELSEAVCKVYGMTKI